MVMDRDQLAGWLEEGLSLEQIGERVERAPSTVAYWVEKHGLTPAHQTRHASRGAIPRETLQVLVDRHLSVREIAVELDRSYGTIRHWLRKYELQTTREVRMRATREARLRATLDAPDADRFPADCPIHGPTHFLIRNDGASRCERCRSEAVSKRRRHVKAVLVAEAGGCCAICGYSRCVAALEFHHVDPTQKSFHLSRAGVTRSIERARAEAQKCVLLCSNCHAEVETGVADCPANIAGEAADLSLVAQPDGPG
jgi:hypothetical protein